VLATLPKRIGMSLVKGAAKGIHQILGRLSRCLCQELSGHIQKTRRNRRTMTVSPDTDGISSHIHWTFYQTLEHCQRRFCRHSHRLLQQRHPTRILYQITWAEEAENH
jgi:hypothetical protein